MDKVRKKFGVEISPTTVVLLQELERFNRLISRMGKSLATLKKVCNLVFLFEANTLFGKCLNKVFCY